MEPIHGSQIIPRETKQKSSKKTISFRICNGRKNSKNIKSVGIKKERNSHRDQNNFGNNSKVAEISRELCP